MTGRHSTERDLAFIFAHRGHYHKLTKAIQLVIKKAASQIRKETLQTEKKK